MSKLRMRDCPERSSLGKTNETRLAKQGFLSIETNYSANLIN